MDDNVKVDLAVETCCIPFETQSSSLLLRVLDLDSISVTATIHQMWSMRSSSCRNFMPPTSAIVSYHMAGSQ
jgi:hypothetical protein